MCHKGPLLARSQQLKISLLSHSKSVTMAGAEPCLEAGGSMILGLSGASFSSKVCDPPNMGVCLIQPCSPSRRENAPISEVVLPG